MSGGLITTRAASESNLGEEVAVQLLARSRPLAVAAGVLVGLALIPGLPKFVVPVRGGAARRRGLRQSARRRRDADEPDAGRRRPPTPATRRAAVDPLSVEVGYALVVARRREAGRHAAHPRARDPQADRHRDRRGRAAGARRRQPAARAAHLRDSRQGRRSGARRALPGSAAGDQSRARRRRTLEGSATREPAFGLPAWWIAAEQRETRVGRRLHRRRSDDRAVDAPVGDDPHVPAGSAQPAADQGAARPRRRRRRRSWSRSWCRSSSSIGDVQRVLRQLLRERVPVRDLTTILEAIADAAAVVEGSGRDHRSGARGDRPGHLPAVSERPGRAAGHQLCAGARERSCCRRSCGPTRARCSRSTRRRRSNWRRGSPTRSPEQWHSLCSCARQRSGRISGGCSRECCRTSACCRTARFRRSCASRRSPCWTDMHFKAFSQQNVRDALRAVREELGPDALVLSTRAGAGARLARLDGRARGRDHRRRRARSVGRATSSSRWTDRPTADPAIAVEARRAARGGRSRSTRWRDEVADVDSRRVRGAAHRLHSLREALAARLSALAAADDDIRARRSVRRPAGRGQDDHDCQDCGAGARARRPAPGPGRGRRLPRRRRRAAADLRRHHRRAVPASRARPTTSTRALAQRHAHAGAGRHRRPIAVRRRRARAVSRAGRRAATCARTSCCRPTPRSRRRGASSTATHDARPTRLVLTKLDEAESLSPLVGLLREWQLPISYLGTGQRVPEDLEPRDARSFWPPRCSASPRRFTASLS